MKRSFILIALTFFVLVAGVLLFQATRPAGYYGAVITPPKPMPDFTLDSAGGPVSLSSLRGNYVVLYFGYTSCPDLCPTTLAGLRQALGGLDAAQAARVRVVFISVDYKRDTPEKTDQYARLFNPAFIGLGGTKEQIDRVTSQFGVFYQLGEPDPQTGAYEVDHLSTSLVLDPQGNLILTWASGMTPDQILSDLRGLLSGR